MTKANWIAAVAVLWGAGFAGSAALAYTVNHHSRVAPVVVAEDHAPPIVLTPLAQPEPTARGLVFEPMEIKATVVKAHPRHRDITEMRCSAWRPLQQGANSVQMCE